MRKYGSISTRIKYHIMNYTIKVIQALGVNLVLGLSKKVRILELEGGGGRMMPIRNAVCTGKKVNNSYCHLV
jgi:hypothetical protein